MWRRIPAVLVARNREFYRGRPALGRNLLMPFPMIPGLAFIFDVGQSVAVPN